MKIKILSKFIRFVMTVSLFMGITNAQADSTFWEPSYSNSPVRIDVIDDSGRALNKYSARNNGYKTRRTYLEAIKGKRYKLRIRNTSNRRIAVVVAVDGRNILSGRKSYLRNNEKMYVLDPRESATYKGWRTGKNHVNRFYFTSAGGSYSNAWGDRSAMGVIAVAVFNEKRTQYFNKHRKGLSNKSAPARRGYFSDESTGTGFGRDEYSPTINVNFRANNQPTFKHFLKYEWRNTLCKRGIANCNYYENDHDRNRFWPKETRNNSGYAPYPPDFYLKSWDDVVTSKDDNIWYNNNNW